MRGDNGLGEVVQKNVSLLDSIYMVDGFDRCQTWQWQRDWWLVAESGIILLDCLGKIMNGTST
ncbi:MAG: hypothetical protein IPN13_00545 [Bacteroidetes bacterium]|nr:hypothetical protein [Bacteroidota bacterium]